MINKVKRTYQDKSGLFLIPVKKIESFGHIFIMFKYVDSKVFRIIRKDRLQRSIKVVSN